MPSQSKYVERESSVWFNCGLREHGFTFKYAHPVKIMYLLSDLFRSLVVGIALIWYINPYTTRLIYDLKFMLMYANLCCRFMEKPV